MPRRPRLATGAIAYPVLNRRVGRLPLFENARGLCGVRKSSRRSLRAHQCTNRGLLFDAESLAFVVVAAQRDGELSEVMQWITVTHTQRWQAHRHSSGSGPVYQGRFKSFPVQTDEHFLTVARDVSEMLCGWVSWTGGILAMVESVALFAGGWKAVWNFESMADGATDGLD